MSEREFQFRKGCGVVGCHYCKPGQTHFCRVCKTLGSNHFSRNCPYAKFNLPVLAQKVRLAASEKSDITWYGDFRVDVCFWEDPNDVIFSIRGLDAPGLRLSHF